MKYFSETNNCRVVIAEDDVAQQILFKEVLEREGYTVSVVASAVEALEILHTTRVDLLIADVQLEGRANGFELAKQAQRLQPNLEVLFISGYPEPIAFEQASADREAELMVKPFKLSDFSRKVIALSEGLPCHRVRAA